MSEDPIGFKSGDSNFYRYVRNAPIKYNDPYGEIIPAVAIVWGSYEVGFFIGATYNKLFNNTDYSTTYENYNPFVNLINSILPGTDVISDPSTQKIIKDGTNACPAEK